MKYHIPLALVFVLLVSSCVRQEVPASLVQGVWRVTKIVNLDNEEESDPGNMHYVVTERHIMTVGGKEDRPVVEKNFANMTSEEILSQLPAGGGFMEYEIVDGNAVTRDPRTRGRLRYAKLGRSSKSNHLHPHDPAPWIQQW